MRITLEIKNSKHLEILLPLLQYLKINIIEGKEANIEAVPQKNPSSFDNNKPALATFWNTIPSLKPPIR